MNCANCKLANDNTASFCKGCGLALTNTVGGGKAHGKKPFVALLISLLLPGLGQFYNGDIKKGFVILLAWLVSLPFALFTAGLLSWISLGISIWGIVDAYQVAAQKTPLWA